jgi:hypothetical protein
MGAHKLTQLKKLLTLAEGARYLSDVFDEDVTEDSLLRLARENHLRKL